MDSATAIVSALALAGQAVNVYLNAKIKTAVQDSQQQTLDKVAKDYKRADVCDTEIDAMDRRVQALERRRV